MIARIFYEVNRSWSGKITVSELRRSKFLSTLKLLQDEDDINQVTDFFSYEHFYVIYCKFWELDKDHDLFIDREDLSRHNEHGESAVSAVSAVSAACSNYLHNMTQRCFVKSDVGSSATFYNIVRDKN